MEAFYVPEGDRFVSTELTQGPWDPGSQHGGPPAALLGRAMERCSPKEGFQIVRATFEFLRPVRILPLSVRARVVRPGRRVELVEASLRDDDGEVMRAAGWRIRATDAVPAADVARPLPPGPEAGATPDALSIGAEWGYARAMEFRFVAGSFTEPGPAAAWARMRCPLVDGEEPSPLVRVLVPADAGSGISAALDWDRYLFVNTDLSVHLMRMPAGEWVCLDSATRIEPHGVGLAETVLYDREGCIGRADQSLFVSVR